jgi:hypothetical protein
MQQQKAAHRPATRQVEPSLGHRHLRMSLGIMLALAGVAALMFVSQLLGMAMHWAMALE